MGSLPTNDEVSTILSDLRSTHLQCTSSNMLRLTNYLMTHSVDLCVKDGWHWFCSTPQTTPPVDEQIIDLDPLEPATLLTDVATFTLTYHAYNPSAPVKKWKAHLSSLLGRCTACVEGYDKAKLVVEEQYLSHHPPQVLRNFFTTVIKWEADEISFLSSRPQVQSLQPNLSRLPASLIHLLLLSPALTQLSSMHDMFLRASRSTFSASDAESHLDGRFPAVGEGLLELLLQQARPPPISSPGDGPEEIQLDPPPPPPHLSIRKLARLLLPPLKSISLSGLRKTLPTIERLLAIISQAEVEGVTRGEAWEVLGLVLERLDSSALKSGLVDGFGEQGKDALERGDRWIDEACGGRSRWMRTVGTVCGHLGEDVDYFPSIFSCFLSLLVSSSRTLWLPPSSTNFGAPTPPNPLVVLDTVRNSQHFLALFETGEPRYFEWFRLFVRSVTPDPDEKERPDDDSFQEGLKRTINFLAEGVQHSRFENWISIQAMTEVFKIIDRASKATSLESPRSPRRRALHSVFEIYSSTIASVAFASKDHKDPAWATLRPPAKKILSLAFDEDATTIRTGVIELAQARQKKDDVGLDSIPSFDVRDSLWKSAYDGMGMKRSEIEGLGLLIRAVARFAHVEVLDSAEGAWSVINVVDTRRRRALRTSMENLNQSLVKTRGQFASAIERFGNINNSETLLKLWNVPHVTSATLSLLLSPDTDIHDATQALIQQSFPDVDDRADCFRGLLQSMPEQAMEGLITFLSTFVESASAFPEACSMAKWMVRCLTDVIDVLCRSPRGLLLDDVFVNHQGIRRLVPKVWRMMTQSIALVFSHTMHWSVFYPNDVMVDWIRDALIFARLMVDSTRTFETAAVGGAGGGGGTPNYYSIFTQSGLSSSGGPKSPAKMSTVGKGMVESLNGVLRDLLSWLRLTDVETLHQTFELIKMILDRFHRSRMDPLPGSITKLQGFAARAPGHRCKLTDGQLAEISEMVAWWEDDDIVEIPPPPPPRFQSSSSVTSSSREAEKAAWAKVLGSSSPATSKGSKEKSVAKSSSKEKEKEREKSWRGAGIEKKDEYDDEFPDISDSDLAAMYIDSSSSGSKPKPKTSSSSMSSARLVSSVIPMKPKSQTIQLGPKFPSVTSRVGKVPLPAAKMGTIAGLRATAPAPRNSSSSSSKGSGLGQLRSDFKSERKVIGKAKPLPIPMGGMKAGFSLSLSTNNKSEIAPSPKKRRTDTQGSDSSATDSSSSDDEGEARGLALFAQVEHKKAPVATRFVPAPTRSIKMMADGPVIKSAAELRRAAKEAAHRTRLRLKPDLESLHRTILQWDPKDTSPLPPNFSPDSLAKIPPQFDTSEQYLKILEPLLMLECWAQVQKAVEDSRNEARILCELAGRMNVDDWIDIEFSIATTEIRHGYHLNDVDVVQIYPSGGAGGPTLFAKVTKYKRNFKDVQVTLRFHNSKNLRPFQSRSKWTLQKVVNLSTMHREYGGLQGMPYYDNMLQAILKSESSPLVEPSPRALDDAMAAYAVNRPQAKAILGAMSPNATGFVLIQGPPGTGKTKTICGLVGKFLSDRVEPATRIRAPGTGPARPEDTPSALKILVCAPSNAAIDEVTKRLRDGIRSSSGKPITPKIVRIGNNSSINIAVKDVSLDELVDQKLRGTAALASGDGAADIARIRAEVDAAQEASKVVEQKLQEAFAASGGDSASATIALEEEIKKFKAKRVRLMQELNKAKDAQKDSSRSLDAARRKARQDVVFEADIICCTLSGAGHDLLGSFNFETVIIDEAAQAVELSALIPLKYQCKRCIMVGDPNQLPPTVMSQAAEKYNYSESMFVRIQRKSPHNVHLLSIQYRMHPDISILPSRVFYNGELEDGPDMATKTAQPWHASSAFSPYRFFNVNSSREMAGGYGHSLKNVVEVEVAIALYRSLKDQFPGVEFDYRVGIVTMYKEQKNELIRRFQQNFGHDIVSRIDFNTVDGFQGQEKDIIILSCVRAGAPGSNAGVGFLKDSRRMNVALTRAKSSLFIIGHAPTLEGGGVQWKGIVSDARERNALVDYHSNIFKPSRIGAAVPTAPKAIRPTPSAPPLPPHPPLAPPPPLPPMQTPKEISAARKEAKKERKAELKRRGSSPQLANGDSPSTSTTTADSEQPKKKKKRSKEERRKEKAESNDGWAEKVKTADSDSSSEESVASSRAGPPTAAGLNPAHKRKLDDLNSFPKASSPVSKPSNGTSPSSHSANATTTHPAPPPPPPSPPPPIAKAPSIPKPPPRLKAAPNLFMPSKRKPHKPNPTPSSSSSTSGAVPPPGQSARAMLQAQALSGMLPPPAPQGRK